MKKILGPSAFCAEHHRETPSGLITFSKSICRRFCNTYTHIDFDMLNKTQVALLKGEMQQLSNSYYHSFGEWDGKRLDINI